MYINLKKIISSFIIFIMLAGMVVKAEAQHHNIVYAMDSHLCLVDDTVMDIQPNPYIYKDVCYVPLKFTVTTLGGGVIYNDWDKTVTMRYNGIEYRKPLSECRYDYGVEYISVDELCLNLNIPMAWSPGLIYISTSGEADAMAQNPDYYKGILSYSGHRDVYIVEEEKKAEEKEEQKIEKTVSFSAPAGCYADSFYLELSTNVPDGTIYYTTDGSDPTPLSNVYKEPICIYDRTIEPHVAANVTHVVDDNYAAPTGNVLKGTTIKVRVYDSAGDYSKIYVNTYFVGTDLLARYGVKVINISAPYGYLFNPQYGIYTYSSSTTMSNKRECPAYIEIFDGNISRPVAQPIGLRLNGAGTRVLQQKSLRIYARQNENYEGSKKNIKYDLFNGKVLDNNGEVVNKYKRFLLRNGGDDWKEYFMKDAFFQGFCDPFEVEIQESENVVVFVNGEYFGYYRLRERYDDEYFQYRYNLADEKDAVIVQIANDPMIANLSEGKEEDLEDFNGKIYYIINNDMSDANNYIKASTYFDMGSFLDYYIINVFFENIDWPQNNVKIWRNKNPENGDTRYKFMLSDGDVSMINLGELYARNYGKTSDMAKKWKGTKSKGTLGYKLDDVDCLVNRAIKSLLKNYDFKIEFIRRYNDYLNTIFTSGNLLSGISSYFNEPMGLRAEHIQRYPLSWTKTSTKEIDEWATERPARARKELENYFGYKTKVKVTFKSNPQMGTIVANNIPLVNGSPFISAFNGEYTNSYYKNFPLYFKAIPAEGYVFDHFLVNGDRWDSKSEYVYNPAKKSTIEAVFRPA